MANKAIVPSVTQLHPTVRSLLAALFRLFRDRACRRQVWRWVFGSGGGIFALLFLFKATGGFCRTPFETAQLVAGVSWTLVRIVIQYIMRGFQPKFPKWTLRYELLHGLMRSAADMFGERIVEVQHARVIRYHSALFGTLLGCYARWQHSLKLESVHFNGLEHLWLRSSTCMNSQRERKRLVVLFFHGGGYAVLSPRMYISFCSSLVGAIKQQLASEDVDVDIFLANYRKLPEYPFPVPAEDAVAMYQYLLQQEKVKPSQIIVAGDSAGGGLVLSTLLRLRDSKEKIPLPLAAIVMCPLADLTWGENDKASEHCLVPLCMAAAIVLTYHPTRDDPSTWADASPVHCDLRGLPPIFLQSATLDTLYQHSVRLEAKAVADGVNNWEVDVHEGVPHVFMVIPGYVLPYARVGIQRIATFAANQFTRARNK